MMYEGNKQSREDTSTWKLQLRSNEHRAKHIPAVGSLPNWDDSFFRGPQHKQLQLNRLELLPTK
jgi:hypothetical protein